MQKRSKVLTVLFLLAFAGGCGAVANGAAPRAPSLSVALDRERPDLAEVGALGLRGVIELPDGGGVGGLSGLWVSEDGRRFAAVSDDGRTLTGRLEYDGSGRLTGAGGFSAARLPLDDGRGQRGRRNDSEELVRLPGGGWLVSFERNHRILRYAEGTDRPEGTPQRLPTPPGLSDAPSNSGVEALAALPDGGLLAIEEGEDNGTVEHRAWLSRAAPAAAGDWQTLTYRTAPRFRPTGAAALPDGGVLVLERRVSLLGGWASRIVRVPAHALRPGAVIEGEELARLEPPLLTDNFESIAVRPGADGEILVYIVSDDNRSPLQRTYLALFALPPGAAYPVAERR